MSTRLRRPGFTLVEMLVVVAIIGILATLISVAGYRALVTVRENTIVMEASQLEQAITAYKTKHGDIPPDTVPLDSSTPANVLKQNIVLAHLNKLYPRHREGNPFLADRFPANPSDNTPGAIYAALNPQTNKELDPSEAFVFFLSGMYDNPEYPLSGPGQIKKLYEFPLTRLVDLDGDGFPSFVPAYGQEGSDGFRAPYVYFDRRTYAVSFLDRTAAGQGVVRPYCTTNAPAIVWEANTTFQIVSAGLDGHFGDNWTAAPAPPPPFKEYPNGGYYDLIGPGDRDNVSSFAKGSLGDKLP